MVSSFAYQLLNVGNVAHCHKPRGNSEGTFCESYSYIGRIREAFFFFLQKENVEHDAQQSSGACHHLFLLMRVKVGKLV